MLAVAEVASVAAAAAAAVVAESAAAGLLVVSAALAATKYHKFVFRNPLTTVHKKYFTKNFKSPKLTDFYCNTSDDLIE